MNGGDYAYDAYYSSAAGGRLCVVVHNNTGKDRDMQVQMNTWARGSLAKDTGIVHAYIGPVQISNAEGKCITVEADVWYKSMPYVRMPVLTMYQVIDGKMNHVCLPLPKG